MLIASSVNAKTDARIQSNSLLVHGRLCGLRIRCVCVSWKTARGEQDSARAPVPTAVSGDRRGPCVVALPLLPLIGKPGCRAEHEVRGLATIRAARSRAGRGNREARSGDRGVQCEKWEMVRSIGADRATDYKTGDFRTEIGRYDMRRDCAGNRSRKQCRRALGRQRYVCSRPVLGLGAC